MEDKKKNKLKRYARPLLGLVISGLLLWQLFAHIDLGQLRTTLLAAKAWPIALGVASVAIGFVLRSWRWHLMLRHFSQKVQFRHSAAIFVSSFALNNTLPLRAGDLARTFMYAKELDTPPATLAATLLIERLLDAATLLLIFFLGLWFMPAEKIPPIWMGYIHHAGEIFSVLAVLGVAVLVLLPKLAPPLLLRIERSQSRSPRVEKIKQLLLQFARALGLLSAPGLVIQLVVLSLLAWGLEGGIFWAASLSLSIDLPSYAHLFALATATLATLLPGPPGNLGTFDYFAVLGLSVYGANRTDAASLALLAHLLVWLPVTLVGGILILRRQGKNALQQIHQLEEEHP